MDKVRWGLISTARINSHVMPAIKESKRGQLAAVASRDKAKAEAYAAKWGIPRAFGDYQAMLDSGEVDAVYVSLPNHLHAEWSIKALQAGVHVLCEKPFATTLEEVDKMIAASKEHKRVLAEAFMYRHHPQNKLLGEWVHGGRLGELLFVRAAFTFSLDNDNDVRLNKDYGGGSLWDIGVYPISFAQFVFGSAPKTVSAVQALGRGGVEESIGGLMQYPGGQFAQVASSFRSPYYTMAEVTGTDGKLLLTRPFNQVEETSTMTFFPKQGEPQDIPFPHKMLYLGEVEDMHAAILDGAQPLISLEETRNHVKSVLALYRAAQSGEVVTLD
jgi:xylose dehydrogenase (NAD/NADP)